VGLDVVAGPDSALVCEGLGQLSPADLSGDPLLLLLSAESAWHVGDTVRALRTARLAVHMAERADDERTLRKAHLAVARFRISLGDYQGIADELTPLVSRWSSVDDLDDVCSLLSSAQLAYALAGDRDGLGSCQSIANTLRVGAGEGDSALIRLDYADGLIAALLEGDYLSAYRMFSGLAAHAGSGTRQRVTALNNLASAALLAGLVTESARGAEAGLLVAASRRVDEAVVASLASVLAVASAIGEARAPSFLTIEQAVDAEVVGRDRFGLASALTLSAMELLAFGERSVAFTYSERAVSAAIDTGSPVLTWLAELIRAMCCLAVDDVDRARATATRVLPQVEAIAADGHVLHARLILAEAAMRDGDLAMAVEHVSRVAAHIEEKSPALVVACYLRAFPDLLGPFVLAMGIDGVPVRILRLLTGEYEQAALAGASAVLTTAESARLKDRMGREAALAASRETSVVQEPAVCEVRLLGGMQVRTPHRSVTEKHWVKRKSRVLFAMLVCRGTDVPRAEIIDHLWGTMTEERGLSNFYVVWSAMKRALTPKGSSDGPYVEHMGGVCRVVPGSVVSDLDLFRAASTRARTARSAGDPGTELRALVEAIDLYRGDVLPGDVYEDWFVPVRERFKQDYEDAVIRAGRLYADSGEPFEALSILRVASARNPWREDLYQAIMRLQIATGQRAAAIETYLVCRTRLVEDLGIDPSRETVALYEQALGMDPEEEKAPVRGLVGKR